MNEIFLKNIKFKSFRSFKDFQEIGELPKNGIIGVIGKNLNTGGSSGSGKSSTLLTIPFSFGFCPYPATELQSWLTEDKMQVSLELSTTCGIIAVNKGEENSFVTPDKKIIGAKAIANSIKELIKIPLEFLEVLTFRKQKSRGHFVSMTDSEKKDFLSKLLGLEEIESQIANSNSKVKEVEINISQLEAIISILEKEVQEPNKPKLSYTVNLEIANKSLRAQEKAGTEELEALTAQIVAAKTLIANENAKRYIENDLVSDVHSLDQIKTPSGLQRTRAIAESSSTSGTTRHLAAREASKKNRPNESENEECQNTNQILNDQNPNANENAISQLKLHKENVNNKIKIEVNNSVNSKKTLNEKIKLLNSQISECNKEINKINVLSLKLKELKAKIEGIKAQKCPTCSQTWLDAQVNLANLENEGKIIEVQIQSSIKAKDLLLNLTKDKEEAENQLINYNNPLLDLLNKEKIDVESQITKIEAERNYIKQYKINQFNEEKSIRIKDLEDNLKPLVDKYNELKEEIFKIQSEIKANNLNIQNINKINEIEKANYDLALKKYNELKEKIQKSQESLDSFKLIYNQECDLAAMFKSFLGAIFEEVLNEIAFETNEMLRLLPNVATTVIQFNTEVVSQKGITRQEIKPVLYKNGTCISLKSGLSGGQETSVELAVDLAISRVIERRSGISFKWMILDEAWDGLDVITKESCLELLKNAAKDKLIIIIDHASEVKDYFDKTIIVESFNDVSSIKGIN